MSRPPTSRDSRRRRRLTPAIGSLLVGAATTALVLAAYSLGWLQRIDHLGYDTFFRRLGGIEADPRILLVDIDDSTLRRVGRWPWDRRKLAGMIDVLSDLGATHIVLDMTFRTPQPVRVETPPNDARLGGPATTAGPQLEASGLIIRDDDELAASMLRAANVYFGVDYQPVESAGRPTSQSSSRLPDPNQARFSNVAGRLMRDFSLTEADLRRLEHWPEDEPLPLAELKAVAARAACNEYLYSHVGLEFESFLDRILPGHPPSELSPDVEDLRLAFTEEVASRALMNRWPAPHSTLPNFIPKGAGLNPPVLRLCWAARGLGSVVLEDGDGASTVRSLPLVADVDGRLIPHLSFAAACAISRRPMDTLYWNGSVLESMPDTSSFSVPAPSSDVGKCCGGEEPEREFWLIPLMESGTTLIPWAKPSTPDRPAWLNTFRHLPAGRLAELFNRIESIEENERWLNEKRSHAVDWATRLTQDRWNAYAEKIRERNTATAAIRHAKTAGEAQLLRTRIAELTRTVSDLEEEALKLVEVARGACADLSAGSQTPPECREIAAFEAALSDAALARFERNQERLRQEVERLSNSLRPQIEGRVCLVGLVGTGAADFVNTPIESHCPGVAVHAHMLNGLLQQRFVKPIGLALNLSTLCALGCMATWTAARASMERSLLVVILAGAILVMSCAVLFRSDLTVISWAPGLFMLGAVWVAVIAYRQTTEERQRRRVTRMLAQYTSPAVAAGIAAHLDDRGFAPQRRIITCFFSDLADFTAAAERLDPEDTRRLLQPYLERVSSALIAEQALVNKFIGDGVFAFFNAPLLPCTEQAARACRAALACLRATAASNPSNSTSPPLPVRIGIATGEAIVGDFGTDRKRDYTSIGDTVNVASRLETANKTLGTSILVSESARQAAGDGFVFRPVGLLRVAGRVQAVKAFELLGDGSAERLSPWMTSDMEAALDHFSNRRWSQAREALEALLAANAEDGAARFYLRVIERFKAVPPPEEWRGEVETGAK